MATLLDRFKKGLQRTTTSLVRNVQSIVTDKQEWTDETYDRLEAALIGSDLGVTVATRLVDKIRDRYQRGVIKTGADIIAVARDEVGGILGNGNGRMNNPDAGPMVILLVGVNGSGKTTSAGKLAHLWKKDSRSVMLGACDTFRAAATEQIKIWGERIDCPVISGQHGADAAAVAFDAVSAAKSRNIDVLLIDTAGRQHTRTGLMDELAKVHRTIGKNCPGAPHEVWLVVDGSTGTNALIQAREFGRAVNVTGLCLTKLDGSSKGGVVVAIHEELSLPIRFVGLGEGPDDLQAFDAQLFAQALFSE